MITRFGRRSSMKALSISELKTMLETDDVEGMRRMMRHSTERRALFDRK